MWSVYAPTALRCGVTQRERQCRFLLPVIFHKYVTMKDNNKQAAVGLIQIAQMSDTDTITLTKGEVINLLQAYIKASAEKGYTMACAYVQKVAKEGRL